MATRRDILVLAFLFLFGLITVVIFNLKVIDPGTFLGIIGFIMGEVMKYVLKKIMERWPPSKEKDEAIRFFTTWLNILEIACGILAFCDMILFPLLGI